LPITFVASSGGELLGSAMLMHHEMDIRPHFTPWLAGVFVAPPHRCRGIARALAQHVISAAAFLGFTTVYLYTPSAEQYWSRLGWSVVEHTRFRDTDVTVMLHTRVI
jgi:predicted N-acetyltransferase YhbS